ncbi:MAG: DEAD/DEAH box helicase [Planctomycetaceae bacterium]|jgi:superfamily II DNA or RNA helicase|nr:DEAD/DEAH box helicase [Planctomycetaceae bacterium]
MSPQATAKKKTIKTRPNKPATKRTERLTLYDRLSHLTYKQACDILGSDGSHLLRRSFTLDSLDVTNDIFLDENLFRLSIHEPWIEPATVSVMLVPGLKHKLATFCSHCNPNRMLNRFCEHTAVTLQFLLEEKTLIGLASEPDLETPPELLSEKKLRERALHERAERSRVETYRIKTTDKSTPWTDYLVSSEISGKTYRVALRGTENGDSYCSCPDFRTNRLGTCKHIMHLLRRIEKQFDTDNINKPYKNREAIVYLRYGEERTLHLALPDDFHECDCDDCKKVKSITKRFLDVSIEDVHALLKTVTKLESVGQPVTIYPDAEEWIRERLHRDRIAATVADIRKNPKDHPFRKSLLAAELLPYQLDGIAFAVGAGRSILADDMGLGKTIQGIGVAEMLAQHAEIKKVLIVCPASVKSQWKAEIARFAPHREAQVVLGSAKERFEKYDNDTFFTICNYEQVMRDLLPIERTKWDFIILDEGQRIKNWEAKTTKAIKALKSPYALVLSGTPMENRIDELYSVVQFIDDRRLLPAYRFFHRHRIVEDTGRIAGYKNLDELRKQLEPILLRRTKESVSLQLPERTTEIVRIAPTEEQLLMHAGHMMTVASIVGKAYISEIDLLRLQKALLAARMSADSTFLVDKEEPAYSSKLERLEELLGDLLLEWDRKIVLFSEWTTMLDMIEPILHKNKAGFVRLDGKVPQKKRQMLVRQFMDDPDCRVFITTNAGSVGLNLQAANTVVNVDLPWNPAILEQRIGRAHRMGQKRQVQVFLLVTEQTIEEQMLATLSAKHDLALAALDIGSDVSEVVMKSGVEELKRRLEVLLGSKPAAPEDLSVKTTMEKMTEAAAPRNEKEERIVQAGSEIIESIFKFVGTIAEQAAQPASSSASSIPTLVTAAKEVLPQIQKSVADVIRLETDADGKTKLSFTLPEKPVLDGLLQAATQWLGTFGESK